MLEEQARRACRHFVGLRNLLGELPRAHPARAALAAAVLHAEQTWRALADDLTETDAERRRAATAIGSRSSSRRHT